MNFTTFFDSNYLPKGIVLYYSLLKQIKQPFKLFLLCLDDNIYNFFLTNKNDFQNIELIKLFEFEDDIPELKFAKKNRTLIEYYFTLSPFLPLYLLQKYNLNHICSMDADLFFYSSPEKIFDNLSKYSIIITPHKFSNDLKDREKYGLYNVSFQIFKNNEIGIECLTKWKNECIAWCKDEYDEINNRFADQKYLDSWEKKYSNNLLILKGPDTGLAIWNVNKYNLNITNNILFSNGEIVIFYHFHNFKSITNKIALNGFFNYNVKRNILIDTIYKNYWKELLSVVNFYKLNIDKSIRLKTTSVFSKLMNECSFYFFGKIKISHFNLKYIPKILRKSLVKIYG